MGLPNVPRKGRGKYTSWVVIPFILCAGVHRSTETRYEGMANSAVMQYSASTQPSSASKIDDVFETPESWYGSNGVTVRPKIVESIDAKYRESECG
jgi:hypothetical protein